MAKRYLRRPGGALLAALLFSSCGLKVGEEAKGREPFVIQPQAGAVCSSIDYRAVFRGWLRRESSEKKLKEAFLCASNMLSQAAGAVQGEREGSFSQAELKNFLQDPLTIRFLEGMGVSKASLFVYQLTKEESFERLFEIKNFAIEVIRAQGAALDSSKVCESSRSRLYKWEIEALVSFLGKISEWMAESGRISDRVFAVLEAQGGMEREALSFADYPARRLLPALRKGFADDPALSLYLQRAAFLLFSPPPSLLSSQRLFRRPPLFERHRRKALSYLKALSSVASRGAVLPLSPRIEKSDIQALAAAAGAAKILLSSYDRNGDLMVTRKEFLESSVCLEDFLLPLFSGRKPAFRYFLEFQEDPRDRWGHYYWDMFFGDDEFFLFMDDFIRIMASIFKLFFPLSP